MGDDAENDKEAFGEVTKFLSGGVVFLGSLFTVLGVNSDKFDRMTLNQPVLTVVALVGVIAAVCLSAAAIIARIGGGHRRMQIALLSAGTTMLFVGVVGAAVGVSRIPGDGDTPSITATVSFEAGLSVVGTASTRGIRAKDEVNVMVEGLTQVDPENEEIAVTELFRASVGPDSAGNVEVPFTVRLPPRRYHYVIVSAWLGDNEVNCLALIDVTEQRKGCSSLQVPDVSAPVSAVATWDAPGSPGQSVLIDIRAEGVAKEEYVTVAVDSAQVEPSAGLLYLTAIAPDADGKVTRELKVPVGPAEGEVCVSVRLSKQHADRGPGCPGTGWQQSRLRVPTRSGA